VPMGWWVLEEACRQFMDWEKTPRPPLVLHVNLSAKQLHDPFAAGIILDTIGRFGMPADRLVLELTESSVMEDIGASDTAMKKLTALGVRMGVDDFGTGYSSLGYLQKLPVSVLKIDKSFVDDVARSKRGAALVRAIIGVGSALDLQVIAEGVEDVGQVGRLRALDCRYAQGYYFSRPLDAEAMTKYLDAARPSG
jgi:EAL domain-containing protein (putative c-di-GMP-specific phosphodiesterase class I)